MTQVFNDDGSLVPVTIVDIAGNLYLGKRTIEKDGYEAVILGVGKKKASSKLETAKYKEVGFTPEMIIESKGETEVEESVGPRNIANLDNKKITVTGISKGKGFQGGMKRWNFVGSKKTHGQSDRMRAPGSIGSGTTPGRVYKGKKMAGHLGTEKITVKNLQVVKHLVDENLILVKGAIPGSKGSKIIISVLD